MHTSVAPALSLAVLSLISGAALVNQPTSAAYAPPAKTEQLVAANAPAVVPIARRVDMKVAQLVAMPDAARAHTAIIEVDRARVEALANSGGGILSDFPLGNTQTVSLALTPVQPFESDAIIEAMKRDENGHMVAQRLTPNGAFLAGTVLGAEDSHAFLAVSDAGTFGYVELDNHTFIISSGTYGKRQPTVSYDLTALPAGLIETPPWICETAEPAVPPTSGAEGGIAGTTPCRQVRIAYGLGETIRSRRSVEAIGSQHFNSAITRAPVAAPQASRIDCIHNALVDDKATTFTCQSSLREDQSAFGGALCARNFERAVCSAQIALRHDGHRRRERGEDHQEHHGQDACDTTTHACACRKVVTQRCLEWLHE